MKEGEKTGWFTHPCQVSPCAAHPPLSQSALQFRQLGNGTPGLGDQAFVRDGGAAEIQHRLDRLALLHAHFPLGEHGHRPHQQLLQEGLGLVQHLEYREVRATQGNAPLTERDAARLF